jgi:flagellin-like hook-associated protein FlgL
MVRIVDGAGTERVVDMRGATTLADVRDAIQAAHPGMTLTLVDGERLELRDPANPAQGIRVEDVQGGTMADRLGLAGTGPWGVIQSKDLDPTLTDATPLADLRGLTLPLGEIGVAVGTAADPTLLDLSTAVTVGDVRTLINDAFPEIHAEIAGSGDRLLVRGTSMESFAITSPDGDETAFTLGLEGETTPNRPFGLLIDFRDAVLAEDRETIRHLLPEIDEILDRFLAVRASVGGRLNMAEDAMNNLSAREIALTETISEIGDADMAKVLLEYEGAEAVYQASLAMAANIYQLTLANYL